MEDVKFKVLLVDKMEYRLLRVQLSKGLTSRTRPICLLIGVIRLLMIIV